MKRFLHKIKSHSLKEMLREYAWLMRRSMQYKKQIFLYLVIGILGTVMSLVGSLVSKYIIDAVTGYDSSRIISAIVFFVLMQLFLIVLRAISSRISTKISIQVHQNITGQVYARLLSTDWESLSAYHSGDLLTRVNGDVATVSSSVLGWIPDLFTRLLQFVATFGVIFYFDHTLAILALLTAPVTLLMSRYVMGMMRHHNKKMRKLASDMTVFNTESFQNIQLIKAFDQTAAYTKKHKQLLEQYKDASLDYNRFSIRKNTIMSLAGTAVTLICFCWSVYRLWSGHITYGTMTLFLQLAGSLSGAFSALAAMLPSAINAATAAGRIMAITELPQEDLGDPQAAKDWIHQHGKTGFSIAAQDLSYHYEDGTEVLSHVHFEADSNQIIALTGPSGEGKTTLLRLILGIVQPKGGTLHLQNEAGVSLPIGPATRCLFSYVPQGNTLFSGTIEENLKLIHPDATKEDLQRVLEIACAKEFVDQLPLGLQTPVKERGGGLSEGQLQRLCIARALLSDAPILIMDEATSALDMETERKVLQNIMRSEKDRTCILSTHRPSTLSICHRIYYVHNDNLTPITAEEFEQKIKRAKQ